MLSKSSTFLQFASILMLSVRSVMTGDCGCGRSSSVTNFNPSGTFYPPPDPYEGIQFVVRPAELPKPTIQVPAPVYSMYGSNQPYMSYGYMQQQTYPQQQISSYQGGECSCLKKLRRFQKLQEMKERLQQQREMFKYQLTNSKSCGCCQKQTCGCRDY